MAQQGDAGRGERAGAGRVSEKQDAVSLDSNQNIVVARLTSLNESATKARTESHPEGKPLEADPGGGQDVDSISSVLTNADRCRVSRARSTSSSRNARGCRSVTAKSHPELHQGQRQLGQREPQLTGEIRKAVQNAKNEYEQAVQQERQLQGSLNEAKQAGHGRSDARASTTRCCSARPSRTARFTTSLITREKELRVVANSRTNNVRVVDRADSAGRSVRAGSSPRLDLRDRLRPRVRPRRRVPRSIISTTPSRRPTTSRAGSSCASWAWFRSCPAIVIR